MSTVCGRREGKSAMNNEMLEDVIRKESEGMLTVCGRREGKNAMNNEMLHVRRKEFGGMLTVCGRRERRRAVVKERCLRGYQLSGNLKERVQDLRGGGTNRLWKRGKDINSLYGKVYS